MFCVGLQPLMEWMFNLVTSAKLLELSNPSQPLLRRLMLEAPGTYHHSMVVADVYKRQEMDGTLSAQAHADISSAANSKTDTILFIIPNLQTFTYLLDVQRPRKVPPLPCISTIFSIINCNASRSRSLPDLMAQSMSTHWRYRRKSVSTSNVRACRAARFAA